MNAIPVVLGDDPDQNKKADSFADSLITSVLTLSEVTSADANAPLYCSVTIEGNAIVSTSATIQNVYCKSMFTLFLK